MADSRPLFQRIACLTARIQPELTERDVERLAVGVRRKRRQRTARRLCLGVLAIAGAALVVAHLGLSRQTSTAAHLATRDTVAQSAPAGAVLAAPVDRALHLEDGSVVTPLDESTRHVVMEQSPERVAIQLERGRERFDVARVQERSFLVYAGDVSVTVVGTVFTVERVADRVGVYVERGTVRVDWETGSRRLHEGENGWFPPLLVRAEPPASASADAAPPARSARFAPRGASRAGPIASNLAPALDSAEDLLSAADAARLGGRPDEGANLLYRLLREHGSDPRAPLAAFTLGRTLMMELGRPREAALAFAKVRTLAPLGPFAEDSLAREVEAWAKAQQPDEAQVRAREYLHLYPRGRRAEFVKVFGGLMQDLTGAANQSRAPHGAPFEEPR